MFIESPKIANNNKTIKMTKILSTEGAAIEQEKDNRFPFPETLSPSQIYPYCITVKQINIEIIYVFLF